MTQSIKLFHLFTSGVMIISLAFAGNAKAQDIYDHDHSLKFTRYLLQSQQYTYAAEELERLAFLYPTSDSMKYMLLRAYRLSGDYEKGIARAQKIYPEPSAFSNISGLEYSGMLILNRDFNYAQYFLNNNTNLSPQKKHQIELDIQMLQNNWQEAEKRLTEYEQSIPAQQREKYASLIHQGQNLRHRSAGLAMAMSAVIPGTGKMYAGDWKDGLISMVMIGFSSYQAYNSFNKQGPNVLAWVYTGIAAGFYLGNIYGSYRSAKVFNETALHQQEHEVENFIFSNY